MLTSKWNITRWIRRQFSSKSRTWRTFESLCKLVQIWHLFFGIWTRSSERRFLTLRLGGLSSVFSPVLLLDVAIFVTKTNVTWIQIKNYNFWNSIKSCRVYVLRLSSTSCFTRYPRLALDWQQYCYMYG